MCTLIIPCAGKSSRFPNMKPKWMLTHPDGKLMIEKSLEGINLELFNRIIITIVKPHNDKYDAKLILSQVFSHNKKIEICLLEDFTQSASETVYLTLQKMKVKGAFVIKDSDNKVIFEMPEKIKNAIVGFDLILHPNVSNIPAKSFLIINEQNIIQDIIEKQVVSKCICLGVYMFDDAKNFIEAYETLVHKNVQGEMYISHLISFMLTQNNIIFNAIMAQYFEDWGTLTQWHQTQQRYRTYFVDVDGVILKNSGKYGLLNWSNNKAILEENIKTLIDLQQNGAQIIITTSRTEEYRSALIDILNKNGIFPHAILMGLNHAARIVINDFAPTNPYPSSIAISLPRNTNIKDYL